MPTARGFGGLKIGAYAGFNQVVKHYTYSSGDPGDVEDTKKRHAEYQGGREGFRPRGMYRGAVAKIARMIDNQVRSKVAHNIANLPRLPQTVRVDTCLLYALVVHMPFMPKCPHDIDHLFFYFVFRNMQFISFCYVTQMYGQ